MSTSVPAAVVLKAVRGWRLFPCRTEIDRAVTAAHPSQPAGSTGCDWLMPAAEMAGLVNGGWRSPPDPALTGWACPPRIAARALGAQAGSVRAARDFTLATLRRWGTAHSSQDIAVVVSEMVTNALRHACRGPTARVPGGRSGSACCTRGPGCCARSPTRARRLRCRERPVPSPRSAAGCR